MDAYRADFDRLLDTDFKWEPEWLKRFRTQAMDSFETLGFPTMKDEDLHFTSVAPIADRVFRSAEMDDNPAFASGSSSLLMTDITDVVVVLMNGFFMNRGGRLDDGVSIQSLGSGIRDSGDALQNELGSAVSMTQNAFTGLNSALFRDGVVIRIEKGAKARPIHVVNISRATASRDMFVIS